MKSFTPAPQIHRTKVFTALLLAFAILLTPVMPVMALAARSAEHIKSNLSRTDLGPGKTLSPATPADAVISATKADSFPDPNNDGQAEPGDTITYDVNVNNTGAVDATGVTFTDTIDPNTTLVPGSLRVSPLAFADSYNSTTNTPLNIGAPGVLANDTGTPLPTAQPIAAGATAQGGTVTLNADGSFIYTPPAAFNGTDSFTYTATNGLSPDDTTTVTINVDEGPAVTTTTPANGVNNVATNTNITINFSEPVNATTSSFSIECPTGSVQAYTLSASPAASFTLDPVADLPAGTTCTVTVVANQISDADAFDPPDQLAANYVFSFGVKPVAVDDMETATGNVRIDSANSNYSVLANDMGAGILITGFDATSAQGGSVNMNTATGTFTYNPPRGFEGADSFNYTISSTGGSDQGTVVITVTDMVWFINNAPGACAANCDGRLTNPYTSLAAFEADNGSAGAGDPEAGDIIFIYTGTGDYTAPLNLENDQRVIGQGASASLEALAGITFAPDSDPTPMTGGAKPSITSGSDGIVLAQNDQIHGLAFNNTAGTAVLGAGDVGTFLMSDIAINNTTGAGVSLTGGGTSVTSAGVNTITTTTGTALNVVNTPIGAGGLVFRNISANGAANGINLDTTGSSGGLTVTGNGGSCTLATPTCTGGRIQNSVGADGATSGIGIRLNNTSNVSLTGMRLDNHANFAIRGSSVVGFTLANSLVDGVNGTNATIDEASVSFANLTGSASITGTTVQGGIEDNFRVVNNVAGSSLNRITFDNFTLGANSTALGDNGVFLQAQSNATMKVTVQNSQLTSARGDLFQLDLTNTAQGDLVFVNNVITNNHSNIVTGGGGITVSGGGSVASSVLLTYDFNGNTFSGARGDALLVALQVGGGNFIGKIRNNTFGVAATDRSGSREANTIDIRTTGSGNQTFLIDNNQIYQYSNNGILIQTGGQVSSGNGTAGSTQATVTNNTISNPSTFAFSKNGIQLNSGANSGDGFNNCIDIRNNTTGGSGTGGAADINLRQRQATTVKLPGYSGANNDNAAVIAFVQNQNTGVEIVAASNSVPTGGGFVGGGSCAVVAMNNLQDSNQDALARTDNAAATETLIAKQVTAPNVTNAPIGSAQDEIILAHGRSSQKARTGKRVSSTLLARALNPAPAAAPSGETINATIGTLPAGKSVHVQFQVMVDNPFTGAQPQVSNQGTVEGDNFADVLTDDTTVGGSADPTVTPILTPPDIAIHDASAAEPSSGSAPAAFAVVLSHAYSQTVTVNFSTANDTGGANPASAGSDYTATSGTLTFAAGETMQTISVPVLADGDNSETNETFLVNLTGQTGGAAITDNQAVGTITPNGTPGTVVISELRTSGPAGADDDFVELLNNTDADITVQASDASAGWALVKSGVDCSDTPVVIAVIPNGTVIPARGNYLAVGSGYSLAAYAAGDQTLTSNIEDDRNVALFNTANPANLQTGTRLDAVGFGTNTGNNCDLLREGATLPNASGSMSEYSFVRKVDKGETLDTNDNASDFVVVSTTPGTPVGSNNAPTLGAPGPENKTGARGPVPCNVPGEAKFGRALLDASQGVGAEPNLVHDSTVGPNSTYGTMDFRRTFTNNTGGSVTRLRFRIVDMTTSPAAAGSADLRARSSSAIVVGPSTVQGTTLETPPVQALGGGVNSTLAASTVTLGTPLANGASINLRFLFGVEQHGDYHIGIVIETLTNGNLGQDIWELKGHTQNGGDTDGACNTPPVANAGADQTVECAGASTNATLDGSASTDPDGDTPLTYEWREGVTVLGTGAVLNTALAFGSHTITLKVTDPSGAFSEDTVTVNVVDTTNPMITPPPNVSVSTGPGASSCGAFVSDATLGEATASDGCSATVTITRTGVPAGNNFPVGQTIITYTADDGHGHTAQAFQTVTVTDNTAPSLSVPPDQTVNAPANSCSANVNPGTATASDNCPGVTVAGVRSDSQPLNAPYPVGVTTITWTATDAANNTTTGNQTITVKDAQAPVITLTTGTLTLSPPNHSYQTFTIANLVASVSDLCDASVDINDVVISQVTSDEAEDANGNGDGNTLNDIVITPDCKSVQLRRERSGNGNGRVYTITLKVKDSSGNVTTAVRQVFVSSGGPVIDSGVNYAVNGCPP
jgi:uncharacterized repeat protein (TIGR01451 family)